MLTKILFTALVIVAVYLFYRHRGRTPVNGRPPVKVKKIAEPAEKSSIGRFAAYGFVAALLLVSVIIYYFHWQQAHKIVTIRVIDGNSSNVTIYKAYQKSIKGSRFESLDGKTVVLGESERVEFIEEE